MKLIVGLGNPGEQYKDTRHNAGFLFVDELAKGLEPHDSRFRLLKPDTYMNASGEAVAREAQYYKIAPEDIIVVHDDLDLRLGLWKKQKGVGPKLHYGIQSIEERLGTKDFYRIRIGVDNRSAEYRIPGDSYVLQRFTDEELKILHDVFQVIIPTL